VRVHAPELGIELTQRSGKTLEVGAIGRRDEVDVSGVARMTVRDHRDPSDDDEVDTVTIEDREHPAGLRAELDSWTRRVGGQQLPPTILLRGVVFWSRLHG